MKRWQSAVEAFGFLSVVAGVYLIYAPAAMILSGMVLILAGNARLR